MKVARISTVYPSVGTSLPVVREMTGRKFRHVYSGVAGGVFAVVWQRAGGGRTFLVSAEGVGDTLVTGPRGPAQAARMAGAMARRIW